MRYDYLVVGAGLCGSLIAHRLAKAGFSVIVCDKRKHIGGNCFTEKKDGIVVHKYGAHIFRTNDKELFEEVSKWGGNMTPFVNSPISICGKKVYNLPFNMNTFYELFGTVSPEEAEKKIQEERIPCENPSNLEEHALSLVGKTIYEKLIKGYTEKQWGKTCKELPPSVMRRIPLRFTYDNNYFDHKYQGVPVEGYTRWFGYLLDGIPVLLHYDYTKQKGEIQADKIIYTGPLDELFDYCYGELEWKSILFVEIEYNEPNKQGVAVVNYADKDVPYTRSVEHKHFDKNCNSPKTIISYEYPIPYAGWMEKYYPIETEENREKYKKYEQLAIENGYIPCGRMGGYKYMDMEETILEANRVANEILRGAEKRE